MFDIIKFELKTSFKSKVYLFTLAFMCILIVGMGFFFSYQFNKVNMEIAGSNAIAIDGELEDLPVYINNETLDKETLRKIYDKYNLVFMDSRDRIEESISEKSYKQGVIVNDLDNIEIIYKKTPVFSEGDDYRVTEPLKIYLEDKKLEKYNLDTRTIEEIKESTIIKSQVISLDKDNSAVGILSIVVAFVIYMMTIMNGQITATTVAKEKSDRTMELLITSTSSKKLINGKVLASFLLSVFSLICYGLSLFVAYFINRDMIGISFYNLLGEVDPIVIVILIAFFTFGYLIYLYLFAALGATVSKLEDLSTAIFPLTFILILVYILSIMAFQDPEGKIMTILSFVPFTSMYTMYARYALTDIPLEEVGISFVILLISTFILSKISIYIYRKYTLNYGNSGLFKFKKKNKKN